MIISQNFYESNLSDHATITLMNGSKLQCVLKEEQPKEIKSDSIAIDTTGEYLSLAKSKSLTKSDEQTAQRQYDHHLFTENAWFFLDNAEKIFSDSRMFFAPVKVQNALAYTGTSGFHNPTLGIYLEWWLNFSHASIDAKGNLVWYISGSPLSGANCCSSVTPEGEQVKISQRTKFLDIWQSFQKVNNRYNEAKQRCEAYSLEEVLIKLRGDGYKLRMEALKHEMIEKVMRWNYEELSKLYDNLLKQFHSFKNNCKKREMQTNLLQIMDFCQIYIEKEKQMNEVHEVYLKKQKELKKQLHANTLEGHYPTLLREAAKEYRTMKHELSDLVNGFMLKTFGKNPYEINFDTVLKYAKSRIKSLNANKKGSN